MHVIVGMDVSRDSAQVDDPTTNLISNWSAKAAFPLPRSAEKINDASAK